MRHIVKHAVLHDLLPGDALKFKPQFVKHTAGSGVFRHAYRADAVQVQPAEGVIQHDFPRLGTALTSGARIVGVNNRNLKDFTVDTSNSQRLRSLLPPDVLFVSESGVKSAEDVAALREIGADAVLIGETLMRATDKAAKLRELKGF